MEWVCPVECDTLTTFSLWLTVVPDDNVDVEVVGESFAEQIYLSLGTTTLEGDIGVEIAVGLK
jgi:hypothetical protein